MCNGFGQSDVQSVDDDDDSRHFIQPEELGLRAPSHSNTPHSMSLMPLSPGYVRLPNPFRNNSPTPASVDSQCTLGNDVYSMSELVDFINYGITFKGSIQTLQYLHEKSDVEALSIMNQSLIQDLEECLFGSHRIQEPKFGEWLEEDRRWFLNKILSCVSDSYFRCATSVTRGDYRDVRPYSHIIADIRAFIFYLSDKTNYEKKAGVSSYMDPFVATRLDEWKRLTSIFPSQTAKPPLIQNLIIRN